MFNKIGSICFNIQIMENRSSLRKGICFSLGSLGRMINLLRLSKIYVEKFYNTNKNILLWNGKKSCVTLSFDCDLPDDIKAYKLVTNILEDYGIQASFACIGKWIEKYPKEHALLLEKGHEIVNHTYTHPHNKYLNPNKRFNQLSVDEQRMEIEKCHETCQKILDYSPIGFRSPHFGGLHTAAVYPILKGLGYKYSSSTIATRTPNSGLPFLVDGILEIPLTPSPKEPFSCFEMWGLYRGPIGRYKGPKEFVDLFKWLIDLGIKTNSYINFYFDPIDVPKMLDSFREMLSYLMEVEEFIRITTYAQLYRWYSQLEVIKR